MAGHTKDGVQILPHDFWQNTCPGTSHEEPKAAMGWGYPIAPVLSGLSRTHSHHQGGVTMQPFKTAIMAICLFCMIGGAVLISEAATTFIGSTVIGLDQVKRTVTFQTKEGDTWTLPVSDPNLLNKDQVAKGDRVSIEIDLNDRISKITKLSERTSTPSNTRVMSEPRMEE
jgi:hypothetical protein